jgi:hypothetical protein
MRASFWVFISAVVLALAAGGPAAGQGITAVGPFTGEYSDNFDSYGYPFGSAFHQLTIFHGFGTVTALTQGGSIKYEFDSLRGGIHVVCRSSPAMIGQLSISQWTFASPVSRFGGYWANNSRFADAQVDFYDTSGVLIDTKTATVPNTSLTWTWNGWESTTPIGSIVVTGNDSGFLNGFIWYDDMEVTSATPVPEPSLVLLAAGAGAVLLGACRRRRSSRRPDGDQRGQEAH